MQTTKDEIDELLKTYKKTAAKRIARELKKKEDAAREEAARALFEKELKKIITQIFRPTMQRLLARLSKSTFRVKAEKLGSASSTFYLGEQYSITPVKEEFVNFWICLLPHEKENKVLFSYAWSVDNNVEHSHEKVFDLADINEALIEKKFLWCLEKIATKA